MYVEIDSTNLMSTPLTDVFAYLIFFVYNKKTDKYFTSKDTEVKRFNLLRTVWGMSQVLPLEIFNDPKNGYIFEADQCEFGVDVLVAPPLTKWEVVSFSKKIPDQTLSWTLKKFKELKESEKAFFLIGGKKWILEVYPKGNGIAKGKWLSMNLYLINEALNADEKIYMRAVLRIGDPRGAATHIAEKIKHCFRKWNTRISWNTFAPLDKLLESYLDKDGSLNVEIETEVVSTTQYSPSV